VAIFGYGKKNNGFPTHRRDSNTASSWKYLSLTLSNGNNIQYLVRSPKGETSRATAKEGPSKETAEGWRLTSSGTALSIGDAQVPVGIAL